MCYVGVYEVFVTFCHTKNNCMIIYFQFFKLHKFKNVGRHRWPSPHTPSTPLPKQGVCCTMALPFTIIIKKILKQKKNYGNSNISPCKNILIFKKKTSIKYHKIPQDIRTL
jgi:hypothetical protein